LSGYAARHEIAGLKDKNGFNLLFYCASSGLGRRDENMKRRLAAVCRLLLDSGVSPRHEVERELPIFPAFLCASSGENENVMQLLLDHGGLRREPFYPIAELILRNGFNLNEMGDQHRTLLHGSASRGTIKAVKWLLENGAKPCVLDKHGRTPLHVSAAKNTSAAVLQLLAEAGGELNSRDASGKTPLDYARENNRAKVVAYLLSVGAK
jgi:ankyrin repeat protein